MLRRVVGGGRRSRSLHLLDGHGEFKIKFEGEDSPAARTGLGVQRTAHAFRQSPGYGQTQTGAAEFAGD